MDDIFEQKLHVNHLIQKLILDIYEKKYQNIEDEIKFCKCYNYPYSRYEEQQKNCLKYINQAKHRLQRQ